MDEFSPVFADFDEGQMSELLRNTEVACDEELNERIKSRVITELFGEEKRKIKRFSVKKLVAVAAAIVAVVSSAAAIAVNYEPVDRNLPVLTTGQALQTTAGSDESLSPIMLAISEGNDGLLNLLLKNAVFVTKETLDFAISRSDILSYESIRSIAEKTVETVGETGLDGLLESAVLGDSERALQELRKRDSMLMTPLEKLAFFFSVAFCDSEVVEEFLKRGYDADMTNAKGDTTLQIAEKYGNDGAAEFLKSIKNEQQ